jgi:hypothetical protein
MANTPKKGIIGEGKVFMRPGKHTNRMRFEMSISKTDELRLLNLLKKRNPNAA